MRGRDSDNQSATWAAVAWDRHSRLSNRLTSGSGKSACATPELHERTGNVYENKGPGWRGIAFECLRCAEGEGRPGRTAPLGPVPSGHRRPHKSGFCTGRVCGWYVFWRNKARMFMRTKQTDHRSTTPIGNTRFSILKCAKRTGF